MTVDRRPEFKHLVQYESMMQKAWKVLKDTITTFGEKRVSRLAAALAYYTMFSLAPLLIISITIASQILGDRAVRGELQAQITSLVGSDAAEIIQTMVAGTVDNPGSGIIATALSVATLWWAASNLFNHVQQALNSIWGAEPRASSGILGFIRARLLAILMVVGLGFLLVLSVVALALLSELSQRLNVIIPAFVRIAPVVDLVFSLLVLIAAFSAIYRILPNAEIAWRDVAIGAVATSALLIFSKYLISFYLSNAGFQSVYGAAGSLVVLLVWVYYSALVFLFGATFTYEYARNFGSQSVKRQFIPAISRVTLATEEDPWPALAFAAEQQTAAPSSQGGSWLIGALVAFVVGLFVGARKGHS